MPRDVFRHNMLRVGYAPSHLYSWGCDVAHAGVFRSKE
jgi:hypothetical protein